MGDSDFVTIAIQNVTLNERYYEFKLRAVHSFRKKMDLIAGHSTKK